MYEQDLIAKIELPGVLDAQTIDMDITDEHLHLTVGDVYHLNTHLPHKVWPWHIAFALIS